MIYMLENGFILLKTKNKFMFLISIRCAVKNIKKKQYIQL